MQNDWIDNLKKMGHTVDCIIYAFHDLCSDSFFAKKFEKRIQEVSYDAVLSFNYFPILSNLCDAHQIPYYAWIYDSPSPALDSIDHSCNHIFFFDRAEYLSLHDAGHQTVYHLPLAVDTARIAALCPTKEQIQKYTHDISFVGQLYTGRTGDCYETTSHLRIQALQQLSQKHDVTLYSSYTTNVQGLNRVNFAGPVRYYTEMPLVFSLSKINLNITLASIRSGIPLRILDILGSGGFLMSNHQEELDEHFVDGEDLVFFDDISDLCRKADYYLAHENERKKIAASGRQKAEQFYNYPRQIQTMFQMGGLTN